MEGRKEGGRKEESERERERESTCYSSYDNHSDALCVGERINYWLCKQIGHSSPTREHYVVVQQTD